MTTTYYIIGAVALAIHLVRKVFGHPGKVADFFKGRDNVLYLITTPLAAVLGLLLPEVGEALGFSANAWAATVGYTGASLVSGYFDVKTAAALRKAGQ